MKLKKILSAGLCLSMLLGLLIPAHAAESVSGELELREDWRLTSDLALTVDSGKMLTINGKNLYYIYEQTDAALSVTGGSVYFKNTIVYPADTGDPDHPSNHVTLAAFKTSADKVQERITVSEGIATLGKIQGYQITPMVFADGVTFTTDPDNPDGTISVDVSGGSVTLKLALYDGNNGNSFYAGEWDAVITSSGATVTVPEQEGPGGEEGPGPGVSNPDSTGGYTYDDTDDDSSGAPANTTVTTTTKNPDGSTTTKKTDKATGTVTETTTRPDGSVKVVETAKNGTVTTKETAANGVEVTTVQARGSSVTASVTLPDDVDSATVTIPVTTTLTPGTVAVDSKTGEVIKLSVVTAGGMAVKLDHSADFVLVDRSKNFSDTTGHWAGNSIAFVTSHELFYGTGDSTFSPELPTTRAMLMTVLARLDSTASSASIGYEQGMAWAVSTGVSDGSNPDGEITREQLATMLWRYAGSPASSYAVTHPDADAISDYAQTAMSWAVQVGILTGYEDGTLHPEASATRAVVAAMLQRFCATLV